jgi:hypothetical protein
MTGFYDAVIGCLHYSFGATAINISKLLAEYIGIYNIYKVVTTN